MFKRSTKAPPVYYVSYALLVGLSLVSSSYQITQNISTEGVGRAISAIDALQQWYDESTGLWDTTAWWNSANALTMLADFSSLDPSLDEVTHHVFENTFDKAQRIDARVVKRMTSSSIKSLNIPHFVLPRGSESATSSPGFINDFYDDEGWWALAWLKVYDITKEDKYLQMSRSIFEDTTKGWGAPCGGLWWNKAHTYTGAIENELFLSVAAQLANRVPLTNKQYYLDWALKEWNWFQRSGMINDQHTINNGIDFKTCQNDKGTVWSYNQGVILGGLIELHKAAPDDVYLLLAEQIATAAIKHLSDSNGILHEPCEPDCGGDGSQFKGIFMRNLQMVQQLGPNDEIDKFIQANAESIWFHDRGLYNQMGLVWSGPFSSATASTQSSACDALVAAMAHPDFSNI